MKKLIAYLLAAMMVLSLTVAAYASDQSSDPIWSFTQDEDGADCLLNDQTGERVYEAFGFDASGNIEKIDLEEYAQLLYESQIFEESRQSEHAQSLLKSFEEITPYDVTQSTYYFYNETSKSVISGSRAKVSADHVGPATIDVVYTTTITEGFSIPLSLNVSAMKDKIKIGAGFTWNINLSSSTSVGGSFQVASGKTGYLSFTPYLNKTTGTAYSEIRYSNGNVTKTPTESVSGTSPIKLSNGIADGVYAVVYK